MTIGKTRPRLGADSIRNSIQSLEQFKQLEQFKVVIFFVMEYLVVELLVEMILAPEFMNHHQQ